MFDRYRPLIEECAAAGCGAKDIAGMLGEGYDHRSLYDYMGRRGIRTSPKKCGECQYRTTVKNISHTGDIWVCQKYRMQISKRGGTPVQCRKDTVDQIHKILETKYEQADH